MRRARFGHTGKMSLQTLINQRVNWWAVRDSNPRAYRIFSNLLNSHVGQLGEVGIVVTLRHVLGTVPLHSCDLALLELARTLFCGYLCRMADSRLEDKRLAYGKKLLLFLSGTLVTVLVRRIVTLYVSLCQTLSLRKLCVAHTRAKGAFRENSSGFISRLCSFHPACVYADCHAQSCASSRTARAPWITAPMSSGVWCFEKAAYRKASAQIAELMPGAPVWGCLAY